MLVTEQLLWSHHDSVRIQPTVHLSPDTQTADQFLVHELQDSPDVIAIHPGDQHLPLVIVDEESTDHGRQRQSELIIVKSRCSIDMNNRHSLFLYQPDFNLIWQMLQLS